ncbi:MAG: hypothetical protein E7481_04670 [Ruminococcaceae bacterium]|nr:hypothetical protein [Oscillospiraceae bacterium]
MITILPEYTLDGGSFTLCEDGKELAKCIYEAAPGRGEITELIFDEGCNFSRIDGVVRAVLNSLDLRGVTTVTCKNKKIFPELEKVGFTVKEEFAVINTTEFFDQPCHGQE